MRNRLLAVALAALVVGTGCHRRWCRVESDRLPPTRLEAPTRPNTLPPQSIPTVPPSSVPSLPPPELPDSRSSFRLGDPLRPEDAPSTPPAGRLPAPVVPTPQREVLLPDPLPGDSTTARKPANSRRLLGDPIRPDDLPTTDERTTEKPTADANSGPSRAPAGFTRVAGRDGLATGRVPTGGELDWLASNGFRTVLLFHDPKADVTDFRTQAERRNLRALTVPVDAADLATAYEQFARAVLDRGGRPVYVADADPARSAAIWYALFRKQELTGDEVARLRVAAFGAAPERAAIWAAVQELIARP